MAKFKVLVGRDARVYYSAEIEAESVDAAKAMLSRHGFDAPEGTEWTQEAVAPFDNVELCDILTKNDAEVAHYEDGAGWI
jgi:hypothetical protein